MAAINKIKNLKKDRMTKNHQKNKKNKEIYQKRNDINLHLIVTAAKDFPLFIHRSNSQRISLALKIELL